MKEKNDYVMVSTAICKKQKERLIRESYQRSVKAGKRISESSIVREALDQYFGLNNSDERVDSSKKTIRGYDE